MNKGLWLWPSDPKAQRRVLRKAAATQHLLQAMSAIAKSKEGLSNSELDDVLADNSNWMTVWVVKQLTSLGFIDFKVDLFGGPGKYQLTELGRSALSMMAGQPAQPRSSVPAAAPAQVPQPAAPKAP